MKDSESSDITGAQFLKPQGMAKNEPGGKLLTHSVLGQDDTALLRAAGQDSGSLKCALNVGEGSLETTENPVKVCV